MERSRYLAALIGPTMIVLALMIALNRASLPALAGGPGAELAIVLSGAIAFVVGLAILHAHRVWKGWPVLVTLVGCMGLVSGVIRLLFPGFVSSAAGCLGAYPIVLPLAAVVLGLIGLFLTYQGYRPRPPETSR